MSRRSIRRQNVETLEPRHLLAADPIISEFMAANSTSLLDSDGDSSDWIEIYNAGDEVAQLESWSLTDNIGRLTKWQLPAISLSPKEFRIIFASGKDRNNPDEELHTNFKLRAEGEYLGLVNPQGIVVQDFGDNYLPQSTDVSFGLPVEQTPLKTSATRGDYLIPTEQDAIVNEAWRQTDFNDANWTEMSGSFGVESRIAFPNAGFENGNLANWEDHAGTTVVSGAIKTEPVEGNFQARIDSFFTTTTRRAIERDLGIPTFSLNRLVEGASIQTGGAVKREFTVEAGDKLEFSWNFLTNGFNKDFGAVTISPGPGAVLLIDAEQEIPASTGQFIRETGYQDFEFTFEEAGTYTIGFVAAQDGIDVFGSTLLVDNIRINDAGAETDLFTFNSELDVSQFDANSSIWTRYEFDVESLDAIDSLVLASQYKDGYSAYLNGQLISARNAPDNLDWNSSATSLRKTLDSQNLDISYVPEIDSLLQPGKNVLSIQGLTNEVSPVASFFNFDLVGIGSSSDTGAYFSSPTPSQPNFSESFIFAAPVSFSVDHGFYQSELDVTLTSTTADAVIRYTMNGSVPSDTNGSIYDGPITVDGTTVVRAIAIKDGLEPSPTTTRSYLFVQDAIRQTDQDAIDLGFPSDWGEFEPDRWPFKPADYEMDPGVIGPNAFGGKYAAQIEDALLAIPTMSLVMDIDDLFGPEGIHTNVLLDGRDWERPTSVELIHPDGTIGFQVDAGIRIQGGVSRLISQKQSFRLLFKSEYGPSKLNYPLFGPTAANTFDSITLRSSAGEYVMDEFSNQTIHYIRDENLRRSQLATGNPGSHGTFVHLYINGLYWGLFNPVEHADETFAENYFGGNAADYDVLNAGDQDEFPISPVQGTLDAYGDMIFVLEEIRLATTQAEKTAKYLELQGLNPNGTRNPDFPILMDTKNYIDYLITNVYVSNSDWPIRNYIFMRDRSEQSTGFKFIAWDGEFSLDAPSLQGEQLDRGRFTSLNVPGIFEFGIGPLFYAISTSDAFRTDVSDRIQEHFSPGGAFYVDPANQSWDPDHPERNVPAARYAALAKEIQLAIIGESARWGDQMVISWPRGNRLNTPAMTPDERWQPTVESNLRRFFPARSNDFVRKARQDRFSFSAPIISGIATDNPEIISVQITPDFAGTIFYTLDGSDPRNLDQSVGGGAQQFVEAFRLEESTVVKARAFDGQIWSSIATTTFLTDTVPADANNIRISEINYNPHAAMPQFGELDVDNDEFEFVEIANVGQGPVELAGVELQVSGGMGISFKFGSQAIGIGQHVVVPKNLEAFQSRYGEDVLLAIGQVTSVYEGNLGNSGDLLTLRDARGRLVQQFAYSDAIDWPGRADGNASSLEVIDLKGDVSVATNFRSSSQFGGSPGIAGMGPDRRVVVNEVLGNTEAPQLDQIEFLNRSIMSVDIGGWYISDSNNDYLKFRIPSNTVLGSGDFVVFDENQLHFGINSINGDDVYLIEADATGKPIRFVNHVEFAATESGVSLGRYPNGSGRLYPMETVTFGALNSGPRTGDVVISEIQYDPGDPDANGPLTANSMEYIELYNRSAEPVDISAWRIIGDVSFEFSNETIIPAGETLTLVGFDPATDVVTKTFFNLLFPTSLGAKIIGPFDGDLDNLAGDLSLFHPETPNPADPENVPFVLVDEVQYDSISPWPEAIDGSNVSLNRDDAKLFGSDGRNWHIDSETPGVIDFAEAIQGDFNQDRRVNAADVDALCSTVHGELGDESMDLNQDGAIDRADFEFLLFDILKSQVGDSNLDTIFDSSDLVLAFVSAQYEDAIVNNSGWQNGDWNCDREFNSRDLVDAFQNDTYVRSTNAREARLAALIAGRLEFPTDEDSAGPGGVQAEAQPDSTGRRAELPFFA